MSDYIEIIAQDRPFPIGLDDTNRDLEMFSMNFNMLAQGPVSDFVGEVARLIEDAGLGTLTAEGQPAGDIFIGPGAILPTLGDGPFISIYDTGGGIPPEETHNGSVYERLSCQIVVRAATYGAAETRALAIWRELHGTRNVSVTA